MAKPEGRGKPIVIVGGGFAGASCAQRLEKLLGTDARRVLLIDPRNYFVFSPLLIEAGTGSLEPRHAVVSLRSFLRRCRFTMGRVEGVDVATRTVRYRPAGREQVLVVEYEHLVLAPGSVSSLPPVPGLAEHGWQLKSLTDAVALRDRAIQMLEAAESEPDPARRAALLHMIVVGGSFTGVEVAGEFNVFLRRAARRYPSLRPQDCRITLVEMTGRILPALEGKLADYAAQALRQRGVELILNTTVERITEEFAELRDGRHLAGHTTIWCAGIAPAPLLADIEVPRDERGYILCDSDLRVRGLKDVWAIGDCAVNPGPDGQPYPATAQHAIRAGMAAAGNIAALLRGQPRGVRPFVYRSRGMLAPLGCRTAVAKIGPLRLSGLAAWLVWRAVYLMKMPGLARKLRVALDWMLDSIFPREDVALGIHRAAVAPPPRLPVASSPPIAAPPARTVASSLVPVRPEPANRPVLPLAQLAAQMAQAHDDEEE
jgi:NADH:ubiquinone reductase (H+-translocating)